MRIVTLAALLVCRIAAADVTMVPPIAHAATKDVDVKVSLVTLATSKVLDDTGLIRTVCGTDGPLPCVPRPPLGTALLEIENRSPETLTIFPDEISLLARGKTIRALPNTQQIDRRWRWALNHWDDGSSDVVADRVPFLAGLATVPPGGTLHAYVVFDLKLGRASDFDDFLRDSEQIFIQVRNPKLAVTPTFVIVDR